MAGYEVNEAAVAHVREIDRSFVAGAKRTSGAIRRSIAGLAFDLGMDRVAEGVETPEQHDLVRSAGVRHAQGHLYAPAVDPETMGTMLRSGLLDHHAASAGTT
jgi:EAL domain-containing protein (putative c-di-GMP-specific phosphodiesterase class I)